MVCRGRSLRMACVPVGRSRSFGCVGSGLSISGRGVAVAWWVGRLVVRWAGCPIGWCRGWRGRTGDEVGLDDRRRIVGSRGGEGLTSSGRSCSGVGRAAWSSRSVGLSVGRWVGESGLGGRRVERRAVGRSVRWSDVGSVGRFLTWVRREACRGFGEEGGLAAESGRSQGGGARRTQTKQQRKVKGRRRPRGRRGHAGLVVWRNAAPRRTAPGLEAERARSGE